MSRLRELRKAQDLSQAELAALLGVNQTAVSQWERGATMPSHEMLLRLCGLYRTTADYLLGFTSVAMVPTEQVVSGQVFSLIATGDGMAPVICEGDILTIQREQKVENGTIAAVQLGPDDSIVRRYFRSKQGVVLMPINPSTEPMFFSNEEVQHMPISVIGRIVELRRSLR